jgi:hypothetical protein
MLTWAPLIKIGRDGLTEEAVASMAAAYLVKGVAGAIVRYDAGGWGVSLQTLGTPGFLLAQAQP